MGVGVALVWFEVEMRLRQRWEWPCAELNGRLAGWLAGGWRLAAGER